MSQQKSDNSSQTHKTICVLATQPPFSSTRAKDALEVAMLCGTFDYKTTLIVLADAIFMLLKDQNGQAIQQKTVSALVSALPLYDVSEIVVCAEDLAERNIDPCDLVLSVLIKSHNDISQYMRTSDIVFTV